MYDRFIRSLKSAIVAAGAAGLIVSATHDAVALTIEVAQESSFMAGDWDTNVLGQVTPFSTSLTTAGFYSYGSPNGFSYNGNENGIGGPAPVSGITQMFFVDASDGLSFFVVHDSVTDGSGGSALMQFLLTGDTAAIHSDDAGDLVSASMVMAGQRFDTDHGWRACCTDGFVITSLDGTDWRLFGRFSEQPTNIDDWVVRSGAGIDPVDLDFTRQRVRFRIVAISEPATTGLFALALAALGFARGIGRKSAA